LNSMSPFFVAKYNTALNASRLYERSVFC
jgi:hypothetical protein